MKSLSQMIENRLIWREKAKQNLAGNDGSAAFLHSSLLYLFKATAINIFNWNKALNFYVIYFPR